MAISAPPVLHLLRGRGSCSSSDMGCAWEESPAQSDVLGLNSKDLLLPLGLLLTIAYTLQISKHINEAQTCKIYLCYKVGVLLMKATRIEATYELQLDVQHAVPDFQINTNFAMHITS